jgi:hypothetical protein
MPTAFFGLSERGSLAIARLAIPRKMRVPVPPGWRLGRLRAPPSPRFWFRSPGGFVFRSKPFLQPSGAVNTGAAVSPPALRFTRHSATHAALASLRQVPHAPHRALGCFSPGLLLMKPEVSLCSAERDSLSPPPLSREGCASSRNDRFALSRLTKTKRALP